MVAGAESWEWGEICFGDLEPAGSPGGQSRGSGGKEERAMSWGFGLNSWMGFYTRNC